jgi:hypothetical protein
MRQPTLRPSVTYGTVLSCATAVVSAARSVEKPVPLDPSETALVDRLARQGGYSPSWLLRLGRAWRARVATT